MPTRTAPIPLVRYWRTLLPIFLFLTGMVALVSYSPTLYRWFCAATGYGGTVQRALGPVASGAAPDPNGRTITVFFDSNVAEGLPWDFHPEQRKVTVKLGEPTKVYYIAKNNSDRVLVARAVYNVAPADIATYFFKIECFCFTREKLDPGESARMPLVFYIDRQLAHDDDTNSITDVTLSYTFYPQKDLSPEEIAKARDLGPGSRQKDLTLSPSTKQDFTNDVPRD